MIGLVTDSNAQLPPELIERYHVEVVPLSVTIDGETFLEGVDLDADGFYARFEGGGRPEVSTAQPSPGRFAQVFEELAGRGVTEILAVHVGSSVSGTLNSARLAAADSLVPAASRALFTVPETAEPMWTESTSVAPASAAARYAWRKRPGEGCEVDTVGRESPSKRA